MTMSANELLRSIKAENAVLFTFVQALIWTHHSPKLLLDTFERMHNEFTAGLLHDPAVNDATLAAIEDQKRRLAARIEHRIQAMQRGAG